MIGYLGRRPRLRTTKKENLGIHLLKFLRGRAFKIEKSKMKKKWKKKKEVTRTDSRRSAKICWIEPDLKPDSLSRKPADAIGIDLI